MELLREESQVRAFLDEVSGAPFWAMDTETTGLDPHQDKVLLVQFGTDERQAILDASAFSAEALRPVFTAGVPIVFQNASFDLKMLYKRYGAALGLQSASIMDTLLTEQVLRAGRKSDCALPGFDLRTLAARYAGMELDKGVRESFVGATSVSDLGEAELHYAARDVEATYRVFKAQLPEVDRFGLHRVVALEGSAALAFALLEYNGMPIDVVGWRRVLSESKDGRSEAKLRLDEAFRDVSNVDLFGETTLNYESEAEVRSALARLGVTTSDLRSETLRATGHPAAEALVDYREHQKILGTYGEPFLRHVHPVTGRLHPRFRAIGATTGRASCADPNLQNIPSRSDFRACFRPADGRVVVTADYRGAELRILAEMSGDPVFRETFLRDGDLHAEVARRLFSVAATDDVPKSLRARAKAVNFGLAYGMGAPALAAQIGAEPAEAESLLKEYFDAFPKIRSYLEDAARASLRKGFAETLGGRKFWFTDMKRDGRPEGSMLRVAKNMPIQGSNADITKLAMGRIARALMNGPTDALLVNSIHDELVIECAAADAEQISALVRREMTSAGAEFVHSIPMSVDVRVDSHWSK